MVTDRRPTPRVAIPATAFMLAAAATASPALAVAYSWDAAVNGDFHDDLKWNPNTGSPASGDTATFGQASGSYTVGFSADASTDKLTINGGNTVTFDMSGRTYTASIASNNPGIDLTGTAKLVLTDSVGGGVLRNLAAASNIPVHIAGSGLELNTSGGFGATFTIHGEFGSSSPILVTGAGSHLNHDQGFFSLNGNSLTIQNGGLVHASNFQYTTGGESVVVDGVGSQLITNANGARVVAWGPSTASVINGGLWDTTNLQFEIGVLYGAGQLVTVGDGVNTTATSTIRAGDFFFVGLTGDPRGVSEMRVHSDGYIEATSATNSVRITDGDTLTMIGGVADIASGGQVLVQDVVAAGGPTGQLRGYGTIQRHTGGTSNFTLTNDGAVRPGDTSASAAIGTLNVTNGDLDQNSGGTTFFEFAESGGSDLLNIVGGTATLEGTLTYAVLGAPLQRYVTGGTWDFVLADTITYAPGSDNMATLLGGYGFTPAEYQYGVVVDGGAGGRDVLRLVIVPEPAALGALGMSAIALGGRRRRPR